MALSWRAVKRMSVPPTQAAARPAEVDGFGAARSRPHLSGLEGLGLALVTLFAVLTRVAVVDQLLPQRVESDAHILIQLKVFAGLIAPDQIPPHYGFYPTFVARTLHWIAGRGMFDPAPRDASLAEHLQAAAAPLVALRTWIAWAGVAAVPATFFLARKFQSARGSLVASAFLACSLLHGIYSHQARPHVAHLPFALLALILLLGWIERPSVVRALGALTAAWLCMSNLQTGVFLLFPFVCAALLTPVTWRARCAAGVGFAAVFVLSRVFYSGGIRVDASGVSLAPSGHPIPFDALNGAGVVPTARFLWGAEPVLTALALVGMALVLARLAPILGGDRLRRTGLLTLAAYFLPYLAFTLLNQDTRDRYLLPLLPFLAMLASFALERGLAPRAPANAALAWIGCALALVFPAREAWKLRQLGLAPDTLELATRYLLEQPDARGARIVTSPFVVLPVRGTPEALATYEGTGLASASPWISYQLAHCMAVNAPDSVDVRPYPPGEMAKEANSEHVLAMLRELDPDYVVLETSSRQRYLASHLEFEAAVRAHGTRLAMINPEWIDPGSEELLEYGDSYELRARLRRATALGPPLEIYRWNAP